MIDRERERERDQKSISAKVNQNDANSRGHSFALNSRGSHRFARFQSQAGFTAIKRKLYCYIVASCRAWTGLSVPSVFGLVGRSKASGYEHSHTHQTMACKRHDKNTHNKNPPVHVYTTRHAKNRQTNHAQHEHKWFKRKEEKKLHTNRKSTREDSFHRQLRCKRVLACRDMATTNRSQAQNTTENSSFISWKLVISLETSFYFCRSFGFCLRPFCLLYLYSH